MNIMIIGAAGFIGTNLTMQLAKDNENKITLVDKSRMLFSAVESMNFGNVSIKEASFELETDFDELVSGQDIIYHLVSTTAPTTSN